MNKEHSFNFHIWNELLRIEKKMGIPFAPTIKFISTTFDLSNRIANAYRFAFLNRNIIDSHDNINVEIKLAGLRDTNLYLGRQNKKLIFETNKLKAQIDFLMALEKVKEEDLNPIKITRADAYTDECTAYSTLSDIHIEEKVEAAVVKFRNEYNLDIAKARVRRYFKRYTWTVRQLSVGGWNIKKGVIAILGDLITGYIHEELIESNELSPTEASMLILELLIEGIKTIVNELQLDQLDVMCIRGNHGRTSKRKKFSTNYKNSYEYMIYTWLKREFDNATGYENVHFHIPQSEFGTIEIYGLINCNSHGDHFNYQGGVGGVMVPFMRWMHKMNKIIPADKYWIAHYHTYTALQSGNINGSVIGYGPFAMGKGFEPEDPQQQFQLIDSKRGYTVNMPIKLLDY